MHSDHIDRTLPAAISLETKPSDSRSHQFLAILHSSSVDVSGSVFFQDEDPKIVYREDPQAVVELYEDLNEQPVRQTQLTLSRYFQFN